MKDYITSEERLKKINRNYIEDIYLSSSFVFSLFILISLFNWR